VRSCIGGSGQNTTTALAAYLLQNNELRLANLILIGRPEDPESIWLCDWESPLIWPCMGTFAPAVIKRGTVTTKIGLDVAALTLTWTPPTLPYSVNTQTANFYQLAQIGYYDNWPVHVWTAYMPTPGDVNTFGCSPLFGGNIGNCTVARGQITFTVNSFLAVTGQQVPTNVIELLNTAAAYAGATPPGFSGAIPQFNAIAGSSTNVVIGDMTSNTPTPHSIVHTNAAQFGFLVFNAGPNATLGGIWSAIQTNESISIGGTPYNQFVISAPLPWPPTQGADTFYVSGASPINQADGDYFGFPYVPAPIQAV
jgi:hypothetical protein